MVSELESFLQFIAAIYFTITIDSSVFQRFWNADYYGIIDKCISKYKVQSSTPKKDDLKKFIKCHQKIIEAKSRRHGTYLLLVICSLIVYGLFEPVFVDKQFHCLYNASMSIVLLYLFLIGTFFTKSLKTWGSVLIHWGITVLILILVTLLSFKYSNSLNSYFKDTSLYEIIFKTLLVISIGIPIVYKFIYNWIYTSFYPNYLEVSLSLENKDYEQAKRAIVEKNKTNLPSKYKNAFSDAYMDENKNASCASDIVASCTDIFYKEIENIVNNQPTILQLLKRKKNLNPKNEEKLAVEVESIPKQENATSKISSSLNNMNSKQNNKGNKKQSNRKHKSPKNK